MTLDDVLAECFRLFARGVADRRSAFHTPTVATIGADGCASLRTVVLRDWDATSRCLSFHTDRRAAKVAEIAADARMGLHVYDVGHKLQVRVAGRCMFHHGDEVARAAWDASRPQSRETYRIAPAPGSPLSDPALADDAKTDEAAAALQFCVARLTMHRLEWLWLAASGHRRARFIWDGPTCQVAWLVP